VNVSEDQIKGQNILVVEDIFDSGTTIMKTRDVLEALEPASLKFATLFHKKNPKNLKHDFFADYIGFLIPDVFVIGYGMDYNEYYRDLNHLCVINKAGIEHFK
jgi:hypoxanthine phosphoribosyltransferase